MLFSEVTFLFLFLPTVLIAYALAPRVAKNGALLLASLFFYAWGEPTFVFVMLASIAVNYAAGLMLERTQDPARRRYVLIAAVTANLALLVRSKYSVFLLENLQSLLNLLGQTPTPVTDLVPPIGVSFFTFQALSYVVDVYRGDTPAQRNPFRPALFISLFPQLIAGPIVRYGDIAEQIRSRTTTLAGFAQGVRRFSWGLGKKVLLADVLAVTVDKVFAHDCATLPASVAWLGIALYALQIFLDFSAYSDMAIGLGRMFGFRIRENFNRPYVATSMTDFWRRWHISLSTWFRDYLYIPLGGNRGSPVRTYVNLLVVFVLCGLWHGASWNFVVWGLIHALFLVVERQSRAGTAISSIRRRALGHVYVLLVVLVSWVFFRSATLGQAVSYCAAMVGYATALSSLSPTFASLWNAELALAAFAGILVAAGAFERCATWVSCIQFSSARFGGAWRLGLRLAGLAILVTVLSLSAMRSVASTHEAFIYFRF